ncbi:MAG TPA: hypothetical protein VFY93_15650 [Planctomycetota bacterium]|nr:hypothetical protein [Planctomycetota bacterium]
MKRRIAAILAVLAALPAAMAEEQDFPHLSARVPYFRERLESTRWQVRYCLLGELDGSDAETKRALELLSRDGNESVANQALVRYEMGFVRIEKSLFRPEVYFLRMPFPGCEPDKGVDLVDRCLALLRPPAEAPERPDPALVRAITVVGILGKRGDSPQLERFLDSENDYVALHAAVAVIRLGDTEKGAGALVRLTERDPAKHLHYITQALHLLKEIEHPEFKPALLHALAAVERTEGIQPNWLSHFFLLAAEIDGSVWTPKANPGAAEAGEAK